MKKAALGILALSLGITCTHALQISEIMSNPVGDDSGREWIEVYNNSSNPVDIASLTISIKGGKPDAITPVQGGTAVPANGYAIIGSVVSGQTRFLQDYLSFSGPLFKSSITLVNTGTASIGLALDGAPSDTLSSYTPAKEGKTLSLIGGGFQVGTPTPGASNQQAPVEVPTPKSSTQSSSQSNTQTSTQSDESEIVSQGSAPSADIVIYLPSEKIVVAGAETDFTVRSTTHSGKIIPHVTYAWTFGDGGQGNGSSTKYAYAYNGRYVAEVEASNADVNGTARMLVKVVSPDIAITNVGKDSHGVFIDISNPNTYELNLSQWKLMFDGAAFPFPKNTIVLASSTTRFSGSAMGFGNMNVTASTTIRILFPHLEEVTRYVPQQVLPEIKDGPIQTVKKTVQILSGPKKAYALSRAKVATTTDNHSTTTRIKTATVPVKDTRIIRWVKGFLSSK